MPDDRARAASPEISQADGLYRGFPDFSAWGELAPSGHRSLGPLCRKPRREAEGGDSRGPESRRRGCRSCRRLGHRGDRGAVQRGPGLHDDGGCPGPRLGADGRGAGRRRPGALRGAARSVRARLGCRHRSPPHHGSLDTDPSRDTMRAAEDIPRPDRRRLAGAGASQGAVQDPLQSRPPYPMEHSTPTRRSTGCRPRCTGCWSRSGRRSSKQRILSFKHPMSTTPSW